MPPSSSAPSPHATPRPRVAYQGEAGAFSEAAVHEHWTGAAIPVPTRSFAAIFAALGAGETEFGMLPVWNSTIGDIALAHDLLAANRGDVEVVSHVEVPVRHCLLGFPGATVEQLRAVGSHPAALGQCRGFFQRHPWLRPVVAHDTAGAARELARCGFDGNPGRGDRYHAAEPAPWCGDLTAGTRHQFAVLAAIGAAGRYGLAVIAEDVHDDPTNRTRFAAIRRIESA